MTPEPAPDKIGILLRVGLFILLGWLTLLVSATLLSWVLGERGYFLTSALSSFTAAAVANAVAGRIYERGRLSALGLGWTDKSWKEFLFGIGFGGGGAALILASPLLARVASLEASPPVENRWASLAFVSIVLLFGAAGEEMLFHGYAFQLLIRSLGAFATILPASVLFGLAHMTNPGATFLSMANTAAWGGLLGFAYLRTSALWLPIGMHFGWNLVLPLFGANLSGFTMGVTGYTLRWSAGNLWSGGAYGPEGSLLTTAIVGVLFFVVWWTTRSEEI